MCAIRLFPKIPLTMYCVPGKGLTLPCALCNPPFYSSREAFQAENARKLRGLSKSKKKGSANSGKGGNVIPNEEVVGSPTIIISGPRRTTLAVAQIPKHRHNELLFQEKVIIGSFVPPPPILHIQP